ncbi:MAG: hypothetical protein CL678_02655 [Bdellovibrionaceae bacterium]|nr:hypothetical protein [Pseudobdellovibrionaceae bacterium]
MDIRISKLVTKLNDSFTKINLVFLSLIVFQSSWAIDEINILCRNGQSTNSCAQAALPTCNEVLYGNPRIQNDIGLLAQFDQQVETRLINHKFESNRDKHLPVCDLINNWGSRETCSPNVIIGPKVEIQWNSIPYLKPRSFEFIYQGKNAQNRDYGSADSAYLRGARMAALKCHSQQVREELVSKKGIVLTSPVCAVPAQAVQTRISQSDHLQKLFSEDLCNQGTQKLDWEGICACTPEMAENGIGGCESVSTLYSDEAFMKHRQAACNLLPGMEGLNKEMILLANCEIIARSNSSYRAHFSLGGSLSPQKIQDEIGGEIESAYTSIKNQCKNDHPYQADLGHRNKRRDCIEEKIGEKYQDLLKTLIEKLSQRYFQGNSCRGLSL